MNFKPLHTLLAGLLLLNLPATAQKPEGEWEDALEQRAMETDRDVEDNELIRELEAFSRSPLDLNTATADDLQTFFFLNSLQIQAFLKYRKLLGKLLSIYELQAVPLWDMKTIRNLLPYVSVNRGNKFTSSYTLPGLIEKGRIHFLVRYKRDLEKKRGYKPLDSLGNTHYLGSPDALYLRFQYKFPQQFNFGFTAESDAGEPFSGYGQKGFDFYSFHLFLQNRGALNALAIGDYKINFGQGLINHQGLSFGKTAMVMMLDRSGETIRAHTSAMEYDFYRGIAAKLGGKHFSTTLFLSKKPEDANLLSKDTSTNYFHSLQSSGYHRSITELKHKNSLKVLSSGGNIRYDFGIGHVAFNAVYHHFSDSMKRSGQLYQRFNPEGTNLYNASIDYALYLNKLYFFGETATNRKGALATLNGLLMSVDRHVDISFLYRNYSRKYTSLYGQAFGESSYPKNESGFYAGVVIRPSVVWEVNAYTDFFKSPWLRYRVDAPSSGKEHFLQARFTPSRKFNTYVRYRYKQKPINFLGETPLAKIVNTTRQNFRWFMQWKLSDHFRIRDQAEWVFFKKASSKSRGYLFYQNVRWKANRIWSGNFRVGYFHTDDYDSRLYTFENNVRYAYYIPSFYGKGIRSYVNLRVNIGRNLSLWSRIARTWYFDREKIGSGWDEIEGNKKTQVILELIWEP